MYAGGYNEVLPVSSKIICICAGKAGRGGEGGRQGGREERRGEGEREGELQTRDWEMLF